MRNYEAEERPVPMSGPRPPPKAPGPERIHEGGAPIFSAQTKKWLKISCIGWAWIIFLIGTPCLTYEVMTTYNSSDGVKACVMVAEIIGSVFSLCVFLHTKYHIELQ